MPSTRKLCSLLVVVAALTAASPVAAQVIVDPRTAEFDPSPDHNNATLVARYDLEFYFQGASQPFQTANLGKPAPQGDGKIRVDLLTVLGAFPPAGTPGERVRSQRRLESVSIQRHLQHLDLAGEHGGQREPVDRFDCGHRAGRL
jgi:hypothetical protein